MEQLLKRATTIMSRWPHHVHPSRYIRDPAVADKEHILIEAVSKGDREAFGRLYDDFSAALFGVVLRIAGNREVAEEVLQDAFVKIWRSAASYDPAKGRPFTWMLNIARNTAIDRIRTLDHRMAAKIQDVDSHVYRLEGEDLQREVDQIGVTRVLSGLKQENRELIEMAYYQGYTQQEIADNTGIPLGTVKSRMRSAMIQLREVLKDHR